MTFLDKIESRASVSQGYSHDISLQPVWGLESCKYTSWPPVEVAIDPCLHGDSRSLVNAFNPDWNSNSPTHILLVDLNPD